MPLVKNRKIFTYPLALGLPQTNLNGFSEVALLMWAGHFQWNSIATLLGSPLSALKTPEGKPIYATFYYVEEEFRPDEGLSPFTVDDELLFANRLRHFKGMSIDGFTVFDRPPRIDASILETLKTGAPSLKGTRPFMRMCNVFISRESGNEFLKITTPDHCSFDDFEELPPEENAYPLVREAGRTLAFGMFDEGAWKPLDKRAPFVHAYAINPDRDTNGAGLVYFANYVAFMEMAEREALTHNSLATLTGDEINSRTTVRRKIGYYGNVGLNDTLLIEVKAFQNSNTRFGFRYIIRRQSDQKLIAVSEAEKIILNLQGNF